MDRDGGDGGEQPDHGQPAEGPSAMASARKTHSTDITSR